MPCDLVVRHLRAILSISWRWFYIWNSCKICLSALSLPGIRYADT